MNLNQKFEYIIDNTTEEFCILKALEEMAELSEVLIKRLTKPNDKNSLERINKIIEESGDVVVNVKSLVMKLEIYPETTDRILEKLNQCVERVNNQLEKYDN